MTTQSDSLETNATQYLALSAEMRELNREVDRIKKEMIDLENKMLDTLQDIGVDSVTRNGLGITRKTTSVPNVENWPMLYEFILSNECPFLLQKRLSATVYNSLLDEGTEVPGCKVYDVHKINVSKLKGK